MTRATCMSRVDLYEAVNTLTWGKPYTDSKPYSLLCAEKEFTWPISLQAQKASKVRPLRPSQLADCSGSLGQPRHAALTWPFRGADRTGRSPGASWMPCSML